MPTPPYDRSYVEITNACNLSCAFCPSPSLQKSRSFMDPELFNKLIPQIKPLVKECYLHLLGEPLLHPKLGEILTLGHGAGLPLSITTNGTLLAKKGEILLSAVGLRQVNISLQALEEISDQAAREHFEQIMAFCQQAQQLRPELYLNLRLWNHTDQTENSPLYEFFLQRIEEIWQQKIFLDPQVRARKSQNLGGRIYLQFDTRFSWPSQSTLSPQKQGTCHGLRNHFGIQVDGSVVPCCLDSGAEIKLGNVFEHSLGEILQSPKAQAIKQGFENFELIHPKCQICPYSRRFKRKSSLLGSK